MDRPEKLPFYPNSVVTRLGPGVVFIGDTRLDWTSSPIYDLAMRELELTPANAAAYLRFFFDNVRAQSGRFFVVEPGDSIPWLPNALERTKFLIAKELRPMKLLHTDSEGVMHLQGTVFFRDALFLSCFEIATRYVHPEFATGWVKCGDVEVVTGDLPIDQAAWKRGLLP